jgi:hypothetical protein
MENVKYRKKDNPNSPSVYILNENSNFVSLSNGDNIVSDMFRLQYEEIIADTIDAKSFLNSGRYGKLADEFDENIKKIDPSKITDQSSISVVNKITGDVFNIGNVQPPPVTKIDNTKNNLNVEEYLYRDEISMFGLEEANNRRKIRMKKQSIMNNKSEQSAQIQQSNYQQPINPSEMIFKSFKRNHDITINIQFKDKIGSPDFVKMMMENIEGDIITYYKGIIMNNIMEKVNDVENEVEYQIIKEIYGEEEADVFRKKLQKVEEPILNMKFEESIPVVMGTQKAGKVTKGGKQKFIYWDESGKEIELLPETAAKKNFKPVIEYEK